jgi:hypothetical protein
MRSYAVYKPEVMTAPYLLWQFRTASDDRCLCLLWIRRTPREHVTGGPDQQLGWLVSEAAVAQLAEHWPQNPEDASASLVRRPPDSSQVYGTVSTRAYSKRQQSRPTVGAFLVR